MIQLPVAASPATGRASAAAPVVPLAGGETGFAELVARTQVSAAEVTDDPVTDGTQAEAEAGGDGPEPAVVAAAPVVALPQAPAVPARPAALDVDDPDPAGAAECGTGGVVADLAGAAHAALAPASGPDGAGDGGTAIVLPGPGRATDITPDSPAVPAVAEPAAQAAMARPQPGTPVASTGGAPPPTAPPPPATRQVADAVVRMEGEVTEITLAPAELGSLRIALSRDAHGLVVTLTAERPEALDLLRRHMDLLRQDLVAQGEAGVRVDVAGAGSGDGHGRPRRDADARGAASRGHGADRAVPAAAVLRPVVLPGRIDMRI